MAKYETINVSERFAEILRRYTSELADAMESEGLDIRDEVDRDTIYHNGTLFADFVEEFREVVWDVSDEFNEAVDDAVRAVPRLAIS